MEKEDEKEGDGDDTEEVVVVAWAMEVIERVPVAVDVAVKEAVAIVLDSCREVFPHDERSRHAEVWRWAHCWAVRKWNVKKIN